MENLDLFTPVEQGLPKEYGYYLTNAREFSIEYDPLTGWEEEDSFGCIEDITSEVTHWLDLSKLSEKLEKLIDACRTVKEGYEDDGMENMQARDHVFYEQCIKALDF